MFYMVKNLGSSKNLVETPATVFNHGTHRRPHSLDTEGSMKETFGQLADIRPLSMWQILVQSTHEHRFDL